MLWLVSCWLFISLLLFKGYETKFGYFTFTCGRDHIVVRRAYYESGKAATIPCISLTTCMVKDLCDGRRSCELPVTELLSPYCSYRPSIGITVFSDYDCVNTYYLDPITAASHIVLSTSPAKGFIQVYNSSDSIRRIVDEKNWDKHRQKMLCQHLGFEDTDGNVLDTRELRSGQKIASGDVICYNSELGGTSCCINLKPSTSSSRIKIPYVTCKICDKPLLENVTTFPDSVFTGSLSSNNQYKDARLYNDGWCPLGSGTKYLMIDLQEEYLITRIVTMDGKNLAHSTRNLSFKYSYDKSLVDQSSDIQITGNKKNYQASTTALDIYNVRFIKIQWTGKEGFCLRIELCGEVQLPAPAENVTVKRTNFTVELSWKIPSPKISSYITHIIVYLDGKEQKKITRVRNEDNFILYGLSPEVEYVVGIQTQAGYLRRSNIIPYKVLKTKDTEKSVDCHTCDVLHDNKIRLDLLIPLVTMSFCLLLSIGLNVYFYANRRRLHKNDNKQNRKRKRAKEADNKETLDSFEEREHANNNELIECVRANQDLLSGNAEATYETPNNVFDKQSAKERSAYMSLNDNRETPPSYQALIQPSAKRPKQPPAAKEVEQEKDYEIPEIRTMPCSD